ncbi:MAG: nitroreductase family protein [Bacteroidaceae bacterium]|nr:nitroreductase family protein [Bacteroidaceae bacterium]MBQ7683056.1 nitroreductase family protein [Bacteroidaceae bacterium]
MNLKTRRTVRKYTQQPVTDELLNRLLSDAARTQTMGNLQLYSVVVTRDAAMKQRLAPAHFNQPMVAEAPVVLTICADFRRTTDWCLQRDAAPGYDNMLSFMNAATDALLFCQTFCCMAEEIGLGLCFLGTTVYMPQLIIEALQLPQLVFPVATLTVGWPAETPLPTDRLPLESFVHQETYQPYTPERINTFYSPKEELEENRHFVEINSKQTLAQVFTDIRYTKKDNEAMSQNLLNVLYKQGFLKDGDLSNSIMPMIETRPEVLDCDVVRFQNQKEKWVAFVGLMNNRPYEIFTGLMDDEEGISLPKSVTTGRIIKHIDRDGRKRYDFQFENKRGYKTTVEGLSEKFNPEYWNYAKLISGVLRYRMPLDNVIRLVASLQLDSDSINSWKTGVARALKKYIPGATIDATDKSSEEEV